MNSCEPFQMNEQSYVDQQEPTYNSSVPIQVVAWKTSRVRRTIETGGEREPERSVLAVRHDDNDELYLKYLLIV